MGCPAWHSVPRCGRTLVSLCSSRIGGLLPPLPDSWPHARSIDITLCVVFFFMYVCRGFGSMVQSRACRRWSCVPLGVPFTGSGSTSPGLVKSLPSTRTRAQVLPFKWCGISSLLVCTVHAVWLWAGRQRGCVYVGALLSASCQGG